MTASTGTTEQKPKWAAPFFTIWIGQALSLVGSRVGGFALVWWLTKASGSATVLATATMVARLPQVFLGPIAGALVDRWNRRRIMIVADSIIALLSAWLAFLFWTDSLQIWHVYLIMFARSLGGTFHEPAMQASTSLMVPGDQLTRVSGMNQTLRGILSIATPPLGAFLIEILSLHTIMIVDVVTAAIAIVPLLFTHIPQPKRVAAAADEDETESSLWRDVAQGFLYLWHWKGMRVGIGLAILINMTIYPGMSLLPVLVQRRFGGHALQLGWLNSAWGLGIISGGLILSVWGGFRRKIVTALLGLFFQGFGWIGVGLAPRSAFWLAVAGLAFSGAMNPIVNGTFSALFQAVIAPEMQGRVFTVIESLSALAVPVGLTIAGPVADRLGVQVWFIISGLTCLLGSAVMFAIPDVMNTEAHGQALRVSREQGATPAATERAEG